MMKSRISMIIAGCALVCALGIGVAETLAQACSPRCQPTGNCVACSFPGCCIGNTAWLVGAQNSDCVGPLITGTCSTGTPPAICAFGSDWSGPGCTGTVIGTQIKLADSSCM